MPWDPLAQLSNDQRTRLRTFEELLRDINQHINLVSREDEEHIFERHIVHSLMLTRRQFPAGAVVVDWGTGGGLPAIPLAIAFPDAHFVAVDAVGKKVRAVRTMARRLDIHNLEAWHGRAEAFAGRADYSVSRATAPLRDLWTWHERVRSPGATTSGAWNPGLICLKGGDLAEEIDSAREIAPTLEIIEHQLQTLLDRSDFDDKLILECYLAGDETRTHAGGGLRA